MNPSQPPATVVRPELASLVAEVLGDLAYMVADDAPRQWPAGRDWLAAEVRYTGPIAGTLRCWCTRALATRLAANLLGIEPDSGEAQVSAEDAAREFMNVLCGQAIARWHGTQSIFTLSIPTARECSAPPWPEAAGAAGGCLFAVEGEPLLLTYQREA